MRHGPRRKSAREWKRPKPGSEPKRRRRRLEAEAKLRAEEEQHRKQAEAEARWRAAEERKRQKAEAKRLADEEEERRKRGEAEARPGAEDEAEAKLRTEQHQAFAAIERHKGWPISSAFVKDWQNKHSARVVAGVAVLAALLLIGGGYAFLRHTVEKGTQEAELKWVAEQQHLATLKALKAEQEQQARAEAEAEAKRKEDAEQRRVADLFKAEQERQQRRLADLKAEQERKADEAERQRLAVVKAEQEREAKTLPGPSSLFTIQRDVEASATGGTRNESLYSRSIGRVHANVCATADLQRIYLRQEHWGRGLLSIHTRRTKAERRI